MAYGQAEHADVNTFAVGGKVMHRETKEIGTVVGWFPSTNRYIISFPGREEEQTFCEEAVLESVCSK